MSPLGGLSTEAEIKGSAMKTKEKAVFLRDNLLQSLSGFERIYIGDEFCERRLPSILTLENIYNRYSERNLQLTLATPYLTNEGIEKLTQILDFIIAENINMKEIVINDWGALQLLKSYNNRFQIILGRILVSRYLKEEHSQKMAQRYSQNGENTKFYYLFPDSFLDFIKIQNISRLEFNSYYHLAMTQKQLLEYGFKTHIYFPFVYLTTSRYCNCTNGYNSYFRNAIENCDEECQEYVAVMTNRRFPGGIFTKGNAYFIKEKENTEDFNLEVDRVVYNDFMKA